MKKLLCRVILFFLIVNASSLFGQSDKDVKKFKVKSVAVSTTEYDDDGDVEESKKIVSKYDASGNLIEEEEYSGTKLDKRKTYKYNKNNDVVEYNTYGSDGSLKKRVTKKYDSSNNKIEEIAYDGAGAVQKKEITTYNAFGDKNTETTYDGSGKILEKTVHVYDNKGLKKEKQTYNGSGKLISVKKYSYTF